MKTFLLFACFILAMNGPVSASEDSVKLKFLGGMDLSTRNMEVSVKSIGADELPAKVYEKLKALEALGRLDYLVPDAPAITIEVTYKGETIRSGNAHNIPKSEEFAEFDRLWKEAYGLAWQAVERDMKLKE